MTLQKSSEPKRQTLHFMKITSHPRIETPKIIKTTHIIDFKYSDGEVLLNFLKALLKVALLLNPHS